MKKSLFLLHIAIFLASLTAIFGKLIQLNEVFLTWYRMLFAWIILLSIEWIQKCFFPKKIDLNHIKLSNRIKIMGVGFLLGLHWIFFYGSIKYANVSVGVVCFCLTGFFTAILSPLINKRRILLAEVFISLLTLVGIGLIFKFETTFRFGILLGVISSIFVALFTIFNEKWTKSISPSKLTKYHMMGGSIGIALLLPFYLQFEAVTYLFPKGNDLLYLVILSSICTTLLYILLNKALVHISAFTVNVNFNLEPLYAIGIAAIFFNEFQDVNTMFFVGLGLIFASLILQLFRVLRKTHPNRS